MFFLPQNSCKKKDYTEIPNVTVDLNIDVTSTIYMELNHVGGWKCFAAGYKGVLVYRSSLDEFMSFEMSCTFDPLEPNAVIEVDTSELFATDPVCGSKYLLLDGSVFNGPATIPLKRYNNNFDGTYLHIYN